MPILVVDMFEVVNVDQDHGNLIMMNFSILNRLIQLFKEISSIGEPCQRIVKGQKCYFLLVGFLNRNVAHNDQSMRFKVYSHIVHIDQKILFMIVIVKRYFLMNNSFFSINPGFNL